MLDRLRAAAELACVLPWEKSPADVPYAHREAFIAACDPTTILALVEVAKAATEAAKPARSIYERQQHGSNMAALREAVANLAAILAQPEPGQA